MDRLGLVGNRIAAGVERQEALGRESAGGASGPDDHEVEQIEIEDVPRGRTIQQDVHGEDGVRQHGGNQRSLLGAALDVLHLRTDKPRVETGRLGQRQKVFGFDRRADRCVEVHDRPLIQIARHVTERDSAVNAPEISDAPGTAFFRRVKDVDRDVADPGRSRRHVDVELKPRGEGVQVNHHHHRRCRARLTFAGRAEPDRGGGEAGKQASGRWHVAGGPRRAQTARDLSLSRVVSASCQIPHAKCLLPPATLAQSARAGRGEKASASRPKNSRAVPASIRWRSDGDRQSMDSMSRPGVCSPRGNG